MFTARNVAFGKKKLKEDSLARKMSVCKKCGENELINDDQLPYFALLSQHPS